MNTSMNLRKSSKIKSNESKKHHALRQNERKNYFEEEDSRDCTTSNQSSSSNVTSNQSSSSSSNVRKSLRNQVNITKTNNNNNINESNKIINHNSLKRKSSRNVYNKCNVVNNDEDECSSNKMLKLDSSLLKCNEINKTSSIRNKKIRNSIIVNNEKEDGENEKIQHDDSHVKTCSNTTSAIDLNNDDKSLENKVSNIDCTKPKIIDISNDLANIEISTKIIIKVPKNSNENYQITSSSLRKKCYPPPPPPPPQQSNNENKNESNDTQSNINIPKHKSTEGKSNISNNRSNNIPNNNIQNYRRKTLNCLKSNENNQQKTNVDSKNCKNNNKLCRRSKKITIYHNSKDMLLSEGYYNKNYDFWKLEDFDDEVKNKVKKLIEIETPSFRIKTYTPLYKIEGTEDLSDHLFEERHLPHELLEKKIKKNFEMQSKYELKKSHYLKHNNDLQYLQYNKRESINSKKYPKLPILNFDINNIKRIDHDNEMPVMAFGVPMKKIIQKDFRIVLNNMIDSYDSLKI